jgi:PAS domain S-box-containing protein
LFLWICISVVIALNNLNKIQKENKQLENAINQFQSLEKVHADLNNLIDDSISMNKKEALTLFKNHINQLLKDTAEFKNTINNNKLQSELDTIKLKINESKISSELIYYNEAELKNIFPIIKEIKNYVKSIKKKQLIAINEAKQTQLESAKNKNYEILFFRVVFFIVIIILFGLLKNNLNLFEKNVKKEIEDKSERLKKIIDGFIDPFFSLNNDWNISYMNDAAASHYTIPKKDLIGKNYWEVTPHLREHQFFNELTASKVNGKASVVELCYAPTKQWYENWIYPEENGISVYYREITQKKKEIEKTIQEKRDQEVISERLVLISNATNDALWDWNLETNEVWGNEKYYELLNKKNPNESNYDAWVKNIHPDDIKIAMQEYENAMNQGLETLANEYRFLNKNNQWIHLLNRHRYIYNSEGNAIRVLGTIQDITFQKNILEQIKYEKELSDILINSLPGLFYMFNKKGEYVLWNENLEKISGYTKEEIQCINPVEFVPEDQREKVAGKIANVFIKGTDFVEADFYTKDKKRIPYYFTGIFINYKGEDCMMGVGIDISEKVKIENELREFSSRIQNIREEERTMIAREIHDELGQQLTALKMNLSWINKKVSNNNPEVSIKIDDSILTIENTIQSVRKIAIQLRPSILDDLGLVAALEWQTEDFQKRFNITSSFFCNDSNVEMNKDKATAIFRIYQESLTNVLRHSKATKLNTHMEFDGKNLMLKIVDNGIGFNVNDIKSKNTLGILGMKERANMHGGEYKISSELNIGTTITLSMPIQA